MERHEIDHWYENQKIGIKKTFIDELEERATNPLEKASVIEQDWPSLIESGRKIPFNKECKELLARIAQDYGLDPDQRIQILSELMESPK